MTKKVVAITGGNKGIGRSVAERFIDAGYHVIIGSRTTDGLEGLDKRQLTHMHMDVCLEAAHEQLCEIAFDQFGQLDTYVNNAGVSAWKPINMIDEAFFDELMGVNLKAYFWGCKAAAAAMKDAGGTIINMSSIAGKRGSANNAMYCATKFGVNGLTQSLAKELGRRQIRVNALCPVLIETDGLNEALRSPYSPQGGDQAEFFEGFKVANAALDRLPTGEDVGNLAVFLSSELASAITGQCINVDCGVFPQ
jgi:3-oxoacyl-[acyl-carrier protein] reductase/meso-butanediol dehydrogenase/(S,S)-butanediol dehydrogenase/diacetyl reductase